MSNHPGLITTDVASAAITKRRLVKPGATDNTALQAAAATDPIFGVSTDLDSAVGKTVDVIRTGIAPVEYGGTIARGAPVTSDATGRAIAAAPAAGANVRIVGFADVSGVIGDIGSVFLAPGSIQG